MSILITALSTTTGASGLTAAALTARECLRRGQRLRRDPLTGLANRDALGVAVRRVSGRAAAVGLLLADLDGFKYVNDTYGHAEGDVLLQHVAANLTAAARHGERVVRLHGDEFAILLGALPSGRAGRDTAHERAAAFAEAIAQPLPTARGDIAVSGSIGAAVLPRARATVSALLGRADAAMYRAKHTRMATPVIPEQWKEVA